MNALHREIFTQVTPVFPILRDQESTSLKTYENNIEILYILNLLLLTSQSFIEIFQVLHNPTEKGRKLGDTLFVPVTL